MSDQWIPSGPCHGIFSILHQYVAQIVKRLIVAALGCHISVVHCVDLAATQANQRDLGRRTTGDQWLDRQLLRMDALASEFPALFLDALVRSTQTPRYRLDALLQHAWYPSDVYMACTWASLRDEPCTALLDFCRAHPGLTWYQLMMIHEKHETQQRWRQLHAAVVASEVLWGLERQP